VINEKQVGLSDNKIKDYNYILKMLGLYLYTIIIGYKSCNMLSILNKLTLQKKLQTFITNNVFLTKKVKTQQKQNKKSSIKTLALDGNRTQSGCVTSVPPVN